MKNLLPFLLSVLTILPLSASNFPPVDGIDSEEEAKYQIQRLMDMTSLMYDRREYRKAFELGEETARWFSSLSAMLETDVPIPGYFRIMMAESAARDGNLDAAVAYTRKAIEEGCDDFSSLLDLYAIPSLRAHPGFEEAIAPLRAKNGDFVSRLHNGGDYTESGPRQIEFLYEGPDSPQLCEIRRYFDLDLVAGTGDEISRIVRVMDWVHDRIPHNGSNWYEGEPNAVDIYNYSQRSGNGVTCRMLATVLNECYLALGFKSRVVTCLPCDEEDIDCHVINAVWSDTLGKWLWMDPTYSAYVTDGNGALLSVGEVRQRLIDGQPVEVRPQANWNHLNDIDTEYYLYNYMAKNLCIMDCWLENVYNTESWSDGTGASYVQLRPPGSEAFMREDGIRTSDPHLFWQSPE